MSGNGQVFITYYLAMVLLNLTFIRALHPAYIIRQPPTPHGAFILVFVCHLKKIKNKKIPLCLPPSRIINIITHVYHLLAFKGR